MKRMKRFLVGMLCIVAVLFLEQNTFVVNALSHSYVLDENLQPVQILEGQMPATGNSSIAVFLVDFQDIKHNEEHTKEYMESMFFGETKSLRDYFEHESNGKLEISGDVYGWYTFEHERAYYENSARDKLLEELVEKYDKEIDFCKYDSDKDGFLDGIYFVAAGQDNGFGNDWWPHVGGLFPMVSCDNVKMIQATIINEYTNEDIIIHETGHMLGLDDYYDTGKGSGTNYFGGDTLMATNETDVDPLSKILLGWATPRYISDTSKVMLSSAAVNSDMMVIYPKGEMKSDYFFIVQYHTEDRASAYEQRKEGLCVYRVNLKKNDENNYF